MLKQLNCSIRTIRWNLASWQLGQWIKNVPRLTVRTRNDHFSLLHGKLSSNTVAHIPPLLTQELFCCARQIQSFCMRGKCPMMSQLYWVPTADRCSFAVELTCSVVFFACIPLHRYLTANTMWTELHGSIKLSHSIAVVKGHAKGIKSSIVHADVFSIVLQVWYDNGGLQIFSISTMPHCNGERDGKLVKLLFLLWSRFALYIEQIKKPQRRWCTESSERGQASCAACPRFVAEVYHHQNYQQW